MLGTAQTLRRLAAAAARRRWRLDTSMHVHTHAILQLLHGLSCMTQPVGEFKGELSIALMSYSVPRCWAAALISVLWMYGYT